MAKASPPTPSPLQPRITISFGKSWIPSKNKSVMLYEIYGISSIIPGKFMAYSYGKTSHKLPKNCAQCLIISLHGKADLVASLYITSSGKAGLVASLYITSSLGMQLATLWSSWEVADLWSRTLSWLHGQQLLYFCCLFCYTSASQHPSFVSHCQLWLSAMH